jgi:erythronate-4-phosphate dehydrogenase
MRILADQNIPGLEWYFQPLGEVRLMEGRDITARDLRDVDVLLVRSVTRVDQALLQGSRVRFVGSATAGLDHVDIKGLRAAGVGFAAAPGANANAVVEYVLAAIAMQPDMLERLLDGGRVGIIGYGYVGRLLRKRLAALGIASLQCDPWLAPDQVPESASLDGVLGCDVVSVHTSLTRDGPWPSFHLLRAPQLARLGSRNLLINASRGAVVDQAALLARLQATDPPQCVLDVWEFEPDVSVALLRRVSVGTAHIAGYSHDAKLAATRQLALAVQNAFGLLQHPVTAAAAPDTLVPPAELRGVAVLRWLCGARYDIRADDRRLREAVLGVDAVRARKAFDELRRTYPMRRELAGSCVQACSAEQRRWISALGGIVG